MKNKVKRDFTNFEVSRVLEDFNEPQPKKYEVTIDNIVQKRMEFDEDSWDKFYNNYKRYYGCSRLIKMLQYFSQELFHEDWDDVLMILQDKHNRLMKEQG